MWRSVSQSAVWVALVLAAGVSGCAKKSPSLQPAGELDLQAAVGRIAQDLAQQVGQGAGARTVVIDPILDRTTGQQTNTSRQVQAEFEPALTAAIRNLTILPFDADGAAKSPWVVTGTVAPNEDPGRYSISMALTDRRTGLVVAQSVERFRQDGLDGSPTKFYSDSPSLVRDRSTDGYLRTSETSAGKPADPLYVEQIPTNAVLADALAAYNAERWEQALAAYTVAASRTDGQQLRTFNGIYLSNVRLGRTAAAEEAFGKIVELGLATNNLAVKLLFQPGSSTEFWPVPGLSGMYPMWLRQIARAAQSSKTCLNIVGHTSRSGSEALNDKLSLSRAETVRRLLEAEARGLAGQLTATGMGYRSNVVGTGSDDASDAIDRRVEFKVVACPGR